MSSKCSGELINKKSESKAIGTALVVAILVHCMALFNKYSYLDDVASFNSVGTTYASGRWMLGILGWITDALFGSKLYSLTIVNGMVVIISIT